MKSFEKWLKTFYKNHRGVHHFDPTCKMGWQAALEMVLDKMKDEATSYTRIHTEIEQELGDD